MDQFGVQAPKLKAIARTPQLPGAGSGEPSTLQSGRDRRTVTWRGATVRNVVGVGEVSASGLAGEAGVLVLSAPESDAARMGLRQGDVILKLAGKDTASVSDLMRISGDPSITDRTVTVSRDQREIVLGRP